MTITAARHRAIRLALCRGDHTSAISIDRDLVLVEAWSSTCRQGHIPTVSVVSAIAAVLAALFAGWSGG
jgi:hypothetical protein